MGTARHIDAPPEQRLVVAIILGRKVPVPAPVGVDLGTEEMPAPVGFEAQLRRDLGGDVGMGLGPRVENVVGEDRPDTTSGNRRKFPTLMPIGM
jgi:hypothetical protein